MINLRFLIIWITLSVSPALSVAQHWQGIGGLQRVPRCMYEDTIENVLYIGGEFFVAGTDTVAGITKWDGHQFQSLGCGVNWGCNPSTNYYNYGGYMLAIAKYNNEIYVGGDIRKAGYIPVSFIARWDGTTWDSVGQGVNGVVCTLKVIDNELYVGGTFDSAGGIPVNSLAKWNGSQWSDVHNFPILWGSPTLNYVNAIAKYNGELYVGGNFNNDSIDDIVKFNGTYWQSVGGGLQGSLAGVVKMEVYDDKLYVAGVMYKVDGNAGNFIQSWDGTQWEDVGGGTTFELNNPYSNGQIDDMKVHNGELYIAGVFMYAGGVPAQDVAKWNGTEWCGLGGSFDNIGVCLGFCKDTLYLGGGFLTIDGDSISYIAKWTGGSYVDTCGSITSLNEINDKENNINIYPNPANESITIETTDNTKQQTITIYNMQGQLLIQQAMQQPKTEIDISHLAKGVYVIKLSTVEGIAVRKFIKE